MRHIGSFLLAAVFTPAVFLLTGTGLSAFESARRHTFADDPVAPLAALGALLLAGLLYGILIMVRLSPVGPGLAGMVLFGLSTWALVSPADYDAAFDRLGVHMGGAVGQWGLGFLLGVPLVATITSPRRWRKLPYGSDVYYVAPSTVDTRRMAAYPDVSAPSLRYPAAAPPPPPAPPFTPPASFPPSAPPASSAPPARPAAPPEPPTVPLIVAPATPARPAASPAPPPARPPFTPPASAAPATSSAPSQGPPAAPPQVAPPEPPTAVITPAFSHAAQPESPPPPSTSPPAPPTFSFGGSTLDGDEPTDTLEP